MHSIEIDFDVFKALTAKRRNEKDSYNDVLRRELGLKPLEKNTFTEEQKDNGYWICRGGRIPIGTRLRTRYKGLQYNAIVTDRGIEYNNKLYSSPSGPAAVITGHNTNGFVFWEAQTHGNNEWRLLSKIRH